MAVLPHQMLATHVLPMHPVCMQPSLAELLDRVETALPTPDKGLVQRKFCLLEIKK